MSNFKTSFLLLPLVCLLMGGCAVQPKANYAAFRADDPHSILVVPVINDTVNVPAPDYLLTSISEPIAERGYYVFPVNLVKGVLDSSGLSDANLLRSADPRRLGQMFGADAVLYVTLERWDSRYMVLETTTTVEIKYRLRDTRDGNTIWKNDEKIQYTPQASGGGLAGLIAQAIVAAIQKAAPDYMPLARQANEQAVDTVHVGLPAGPQDAAYRKDQDQF